METTPRTNSVLTILLSVVLSAVLAGGITYAVQNKQNTTTKNDLQAQVDSLKVQVAALPTATPVAIATPVTTATPTATKDYSGSKLGLAFSYNNSWKIADEPDTEAVLAGITVTESGIDPHLTIRSYADLASVARVLHTTAGATLKDTVQNEVSGGGSTLIGTQTVDGETAYQLTDNGLVVYYYLYFQHGGKFYSIETSTAGDFNKDTIFSTDEKALISTIKFL